MKNLIFGTLFVLCLILTSCNTTSTKPEDKKEPKTETIDSTKSEHNVSVTEPSVTTPSVDTAKAH